MFLLNLQIIYIENCIFTSMNEGNFMDIPQGKDVDEKDYLSLEETTYGSMWESVFVELVDALNPLTTESRFLLATRS
jgi:hypothetical protein